jgi:hypothetical protein
VIVSCVHPRCTLVDQAPKAAREEVIVAGDEVAAELVDRDEHHQARGVVGRTRGIRASTAAGGGNQEESSKA